MKIAKYICYLLSSICHEEKEAKKKIESDTDFFRKEHLQLREQTNTLVKEREKLHRLLYEIN